ncbi:hypothetical protein [Hoeflea poritis]|uniref:Uncharacterized protein n=1 Tax=Hoeflea poritis TaxID=2993659 RepID=A0ABT4VVM6_9HYPH|nr:hypothetical protein [Hoeflea poritis]MDA4848778.1 hypothetical protein [Hoeflea poritis]
MIIVLVITIAMAVGPWRLWSWWASSSAEAASDNSRGRGNSQILCENYHFS